MTLALALLAGALFSTGTWLLLQRRLTQIIIGLGLLGHGANLVLLLAGGGPGAAPLVGEATPDPALTADPLPQALALTAIVITFGITAFLLSLAYRSWVLTRDDEVEDDLEDRYIARQGYRDEELSDESAAQLEREREEAGR
jgi:multicomponent Na+:H+ antiporter subunit C